MRETNEFAIEWVVGDKTATVTVPEGTALNNKLLRLMEKYPDEVEMVNSELFHCPSSWVKISPPKQMSEQQIESARIRMQRLHGRAVETE